MHGEILNKSLGYFKSLKLWFYSQGEVLVPEKKLISPDFLFDHARDYQGRLATLQEEINVAFFETQTAVSGVLKVSTQETLKQYQTHIGAIETEYTPHLEAFEQLISGDCKDNAESILNMVIRFTGFDASNCAEDYNEIVRAKIANASHFLALFDDAFSQIQFIVVKSFVGKNALVSPEEIEEKFSKTYELISRITSAARLNSDYYVNKLTEEIAQQNAELGRCHDSILEVASNQFDYFRRMADTCTRFDGSQGASERNGRMSRSVEPQVQLMEEFKDQFEKLKYYEWKA